MTIEETYLNERGPTAFDKAMAALANTEEEQAREVLQVALDKGLFIDQTNREDDIFDAQGWELVTPEIFQERYF